MRIDLLILRSPDCESLFDAQFLQVPIRPTTQIVDLLYGLSQGITDVVRPTVRVGPDTRPIHRRGDPSPDLFVHCYKHSMSLIHPFLEDMRRGKQVNSRHFDQAIVISAGANAPPKRQRRRLLRQQMADARGAWHHRAEGKTCQEGKR